MKASRKKVAARRRPARRAAPLTLTQRVERLEKSLLFKSAPPASPRGSIVVERFQKFDADGMITTGKHVAVFDAKTGLTWSAGPLQGGKDMNHKDAMKACAALDLMGHKDWRAPTVEELLSIVDYTRYDPAVDTDYFEGPFGWTWSSTMAKAPAGFAWLVDLYRGSSFRDHQDYTFLVRAVRAGQQLGLLE